MVNKLLRKKFKRSLRYFLPDKYAIKVMYKRVFGKYPDLKEPKTLNEKINWMKLYDRKDIYTVCADKYRVREFVKQKIGDKYLIPLLYSTTKIEDITSETITTYPVIIKMNHNSGGMVILRNGDVDWEDVRKKIRVSYNENYYLRTKEWVYKNIKKRIIVEELLLDNGKIPDDIKIHCFSGIPEIIQIDIDRHTNHKRNFYTPDWDLLPFTWCPWKNNEPNYPNGKDVVKPENLDEMLTIASKLSEDFPYARIDLYNLQGRIYFGEITFYHGGGREILNPSEWDLKLGDKLELPI